MDGSHIRHNKVAFSNLSGIVWTGPEWNNLKTILFCISVDGK